ncbi:MAG: hypothetical protein ACI8W3_002432 [Myxococcota bacterium]|jgi:hypothetical protein
MSSHPVLSPFKIASFSLLTLVLFLGAIELGSWAMLEAFDAKTSVRYNRVTSGYSVFRTTPDFTFLTNKTDPSQPDVRTDSRGFVHDTPVTEAKPDNTIRIFLNGGSALFGAGQAAVYEPEKKYPRKLYSYPLSIAGKLQAHLREERPDLNFEVINAAAYTKKMHQSIPDYLAIISRMSPDFIINMDGYNDLNAFVSGTPYADLHKELQTYVKLEAEPTLPETLNSYQVAKRIINKLFISPFSTGLSVRIEPDPPAVMVPESAYLEKKAGYVAASGRFLDVLDHYTSLLRSDQVEFLFMLQPMVDRRMNKSLTPSEAAWQRYVQSFKDEHPDYRLILRYFFDDYLSSQIEQRVTSAGYEYIDLGKATASLGEDFQLYTDYCHLTLEGNQFVAEQMGEFVLRKLVARGQTSASLTTHAPAVTAESDRG